MKELLHDEVPEVRIIAVNGVCSVLSKFWLIGKKPRSIFMNILYQGFIKKGKSNESFVFDK